MSDQFPTKSMQEFFAEMPLHATALVKNCRDTRYDAFVFRWPKEYWDHCDNPDCNGNRRHALTSSGNTLNYFIASYTCTDCEAMNRDFILTISRNKEIALDEAFITKVFQHPSFGPPLPRNLFDLLGEDNRENLLRARRAVARGLGVGAFAYYRRIIENDKLALVNTIVDVAAKIGAPEAQIAKLKAAANERQFSKAIRVLRDESAIPAALLIGGHNPLSLLHDELSEGIHAYTDEECLARAQHAEVILFELARLMSEAIADRKELKTALSAIMARKQTPSATTP